MSKWIDAVDILYDDLIEIITSERVQRIEVELILDIDDVPRYKLKKYNVAVK